MIKKFLLYILFGALFTACIPVFADTAIKALDNPLSAVSLKEQKKQAQDIAALIKMERLRHQKMIKELERQAKIRAKAELKAQRQKARLAKIRAKAEARQNQTPHVQDAEAQERQQQAQLETRREAVRKQLDDGVEAMYQDALSLYQQGNYLAAAERFKDVSDIIPGYKRSEEYMTEARHKYMDVKSQAVSAPGTSNVSQALDIFDPNAK